MISTVTRLLTIAAVLCMVISSVSLAEAAEEHTQGQLIDIAGSQRMLTQRMLRDYALVGLKITYQNPDKNLEASVQRFSEQLALLKGSFINDEVQAAFVSVETLWGPLKDRVTAPPAKDHALALRNDLEQLLKASHHAVVLMQEATGEKKAEVVNVSGRQRMLSQRMAALYMLHFWGVEGFDFYMQFQEVVEEFRKAENYLLMEKINTPATRKKLTQASKSFRFFQKAAKSKSNRLTPEVIMRNSDIILKAMNEATGLYAAL